MANPWIVKNPFNSKFGSGKYVLNGDTTFVQQYNKAHPNDLQLQLMPEPFIGDFCKSKLVILMGNPGYSPNAIFSKKGIVIQDSEDDWHKEVAFLNRIQSSWNHTQPFYYYAVNGTTMNSHLTNQNLNWSRNPGYRYWKTKLNQLFSNVHICPSEVFEAELFPYHSRKLSLLTPFLNNSNNWNLFVQMSSTKYLTDLITAAMACDKIIVIARSQKLYLKLCPNLASYKHLYVLKSSQGANFTEGNIINYQSKIKDIDNLRNQIQNISGCSQECANYMLEALSQLN